MKIIPIFSIFAFFNHFIYKLTNRCSSTFIIRSFFVSDLLLLRRGIVSCSMGQPKVLNNSLQHSNQFLSFSQLTAKPKITNRLLYFSGSFISICRPLIAIVDIDYRKRCSSVFNFNIVLWSLLAIGYFILEIFLHVLDF